MRNDSIDSNDAPKEEFSSSSPSSTNLALSRPNENLSQQSTTTNNNESMDRPQPSIESRRNFWTLFVIALIALLTGIDYAIILPTAWGYLNVFIGRHFAGFAMGILLSVFALSGAIAGIVFGYLNDKGVSLKSLVLFGIAFQIVGNILYFIGINVYVVIISRLIAGVGMGLVPPLLAEISRRSTPQNRTQLLAKILGCRQIGLFIGPCFTIALNQFDFILFDHPVNVYNAPGLFMAVLWLITAIVTVFLFHDSPVIENQKRSQIHSSFSQAFSQIYLMCKRPVIIVLLITSFIAYFNQTALETTLTPFTNIQFGWHELEVSFVFAFAGVEITLVYVVLNFLSKKFSDQSILLFGFIVLSIACLIGVLILPFSVPGSTKYLPIFLFFIVLDVFALPLIAVTTTSLFAQQTADDQQGIGQGIQRSIVNIATVIGPLFAGALLQSIWTMLCIMFIIVVIATILLILIYRSFQSRSDQELSALIPPVNHEN